MTQVLMNFLHNQPLFIELFENNVVFDQREQKHFSSYFEI
ncbi:hypothetical protein LBBP_03941 [Leptospira borgpetersenii serovar Ballum]|uniref:Uncharacterized protein n=1 Tax=Leptospira borgpetersenii serovar Ballum TaxID=280505 RepID=A0A0S2IWR0_LEPBO|nr:hypothetical protein LBBP_03941 [Leptospira borgpetersenii serovar Ballum]